MSVLKFRNYVALLKGHMKLDARAFLQLTFSLIISFEVFASHSTIRKGGEEYSTEVPSFCFCKHVCKDRSSSGDNFGDNYLSNLNHLSGSVNHL